MKIGFNLMLEEELKEYLKRVSWENHMSITEYLVNLIKADMQKKRKLPSKE